MFCNAYPVDVLGKACLVLVILIVFFLDRILKPEHNVLYYDIRQIFY